MQTADSKHQGAETGATSVTVQLDGQERCANAPSHCTTGIRSSEGTEQRSSMLPKSTMVLTSPISPIGPASLPSNVSAPRTFFGIAELVAEVVGYLSYSRQEVVKCLYISKTFYAAALPLVYKYIPLQCLNIVDPVLKGKHLRRVIMPRLDGCTDSMAELTAGYPVLCEVPAKADCHHRTGWLSISKPETNLLILFSCDERPSLPELQGLSLDATLPLAHEETLTLVFVPPYISGHDFDIQSFDPLRAATTAAEFWHYGRINMVGLDFVDPFSEREDCNALDFKPRFLIDLHFVFSTFGPDFEHSPVGMNKFKDGLISRIRYVTFKDYLETTNDWKDVLNWRKVGEWLNKYDERIGGEVHQEEGR